MTSDGYGTTSEGGVRPMRRGNAVSDVDEVLHAIEEARADERARTGAELRVRTAHMGETPCSHWPATLAAIIDEICGPARAEGGQT